MKSTFKNMTEGELNTLLKQLEMELACREEDKEKKKVVVMEATVREDIFDLEDKMRFDWEFDRIGHSDVDNMVSAMKKAMDENDPVFKSGQTVYGLRGFKGWTDGKWNFYYAPMEKEGRSFY